MRCNLVSLALLLVPLAACQSPGPRADSSPTPAQVVASGSVRGNVHWGGEVVQIENLPDRTRIELMALPLSRTGRPLTDQPPLGRFVVEREGFLDPYEYAPNRLLEVRGQLGGFIEGRVGQATYRYPLVTGDRLVLWPRDPHNAVSPRINFGIGTGSYGGGVGVGIGF